MLNGVVELKLDPRCSKLTEVMEMIFGVLILLL